uniref:Uncharacterized protein n=1 Tax=Plectus sambesii TaxID=2011161 RepID=A0A914VYM6_9BILA
MIKKSLDPQKTRTDVASQKEVSDRNPYPDILPYDYNRVVLPRLPGDPQSHYCNASYVNSWLQDRAYVVTQSVKSKPANVEFWRMVWELGSNCIVMLTKVFDFMRVMCLQYWPLTKFLFGQIEVETLETKTYAHYVIRTIRLTRISSDGGQDESRIIKHFHFTEWELDSFPYISAFIELRRRVRQFIEKNPSEGPLIVHCSNGAGRSGAFLAVDANLQLLKRDNQIDVYDYCRQLNNARQGLVESVEQYQFIYDVLAEAVLCNVEPIAMHELKERSSMYKAKKDRQTMEGQDTHENKLLCALTPSLRIGDCAGGHRLENRGKNRDVMVVPPDHARPYLQTLHGESKDYTYINAVEVDGFTRKAEWIVTEWPKSATLDSFWTLVFDHSSHTIVNLSNQGNHKTYPPFIHNKGRQTYGPFVVEILNYHQYPSMTSHMVKVVKRSGSSPGQSPSGSPRFFRRKPSTPKPPTLDGHPIFNRPNNVSFRLSSKYKGRVRPKGGYKKAEVTIDPNDKFAERSDENLEKILRKKKNAKQDVQKDAVRQVDRLDEYKYLYDLMLHWYMTNPEYRSLELPPENSSSASPNHQQSNAADGNSTVVSVNHHDGNHVATTAF